MANTEIPQRSAPPQTNGAAPDPQTTTDGVALNPVSASLVHTNGFPPLHDASLTNMSLPMNGVVPTMLGSMPQPQQTISADEIALYDRQIRLWGMQVQEKLRQANVLLVGLKALGSEVAKNLVLAGVGTLTILDHEVIVEEDLGSQFLITDAHIGQNRAQAALPELQKLNPRVNLFADVDPVVLKEQEYYSTFNIVIATDLMMDIMVQINMSCRLNNVKFYAASTHGMYGYVFADLNIHDYIVEKPQSNVPPKPGNMESSTRCVIAVQSRTEGGKTVDRVAYQETYSPLQLANLSPLPAKIRNTRRSRMRVTPLLSCLRGLWDFQTQSEGHLPLRGRGDLELFTKLANEKHLMLELPPDTLKADFLRSFLQNLGAELSPVAAFLGGYVAQDVINVLGQKEAPLQNFLLFDGEEFTASPFSIHPINDAAMMMLTNGAAPVQQV